MTCRQKKHVDKETSFHVLELFSSPIWKNLFLCAHLFQFISEKSCFFFFFQGREAGDQPDLLISCILIGHWFLFYAYFYLKQAGDVVACSVIESLIGVLFWNLLFSWLPFVTWNSLCKAKSFLFLSPFEFCQNCSFPPVYFLFIFRYCGKVLALFFLEKSSRGWVPQFFYAVFSSSCN